VSLALPSPYACPCSPLPVSSLRRNESCGGNDHTRRRNFPDTRAKPTHPTIGQCETVWMGTGPSSASGVHAHPPPSTHSSPGGRVRVAPRTLHVPLDRIQGGGEGTGRDGRTDPLLSLSLSSCCTRAREGTAVYFCWQMASKQCSTTSPERERGKGI
jgi:hypothetical protein